MSERLTADERRSAIAILVGAFSAFASIGALNVVVGKLVFDLTHREFDLGLLGLVEFTPGLILMLVSGTLADRIDRRRLASASLTAQAATVLGMAAYVATRPTSATPIFILMGVFGTTRALGNAARRSLPADTMPAPMLPWMTVRNSAALQVGQILGPVVAGVLYTAVPTLPLELIAGLLLMSALSLCFVGPPKVAARTAAARPKPNIREAMEGLRFIKTQPVLLGAITLDLFAVLFGGAIALLPAIAEDRLHVGAAGLGVLRGSVGGGAALMTLFLAFRPLRRRVGTTLMVAVAVFGAATIALGVTTHFGVAVAAVGIAAAADGMSMFIRGTLVPLVTPHRVRGRVMSVEIVFIGASNELGAFESGLAAQLIGTGPAVVLGGVLTLAVVGFYWRWAPALRRVDAFPTRTPDD